MLCRVIHDDEYTKRRNNADYVSTNQKPNNDEKELNEAGNGITGAG